MTIKDILKEEAPELLFDKQLTPTEATIALDNLEQAEIYPAPKKDILDAIIDDMPEIHEDEQ